MKISTFYLFGKFLSFPAFIGKFTLLKARTFVYSPLSDYPVGYYSKVAGDECARCIMDISRCKSYTQ